MTVRSLHWLTFLGCVALAIWVFASTRTTRTRSSSAALDTPLRALPEHSLLAIHLDLAQARQSGFDRKLVAALGFADGSSRTAELCGFDPIDRIGHLALSLVADSEGDTHLAVVGGGDVNAEALLGCAERAIRARDGKPVRAPMGGFTTVRDFDETASAEIAVREGGPVLVAIGGFLRGMIDAAEGRVPSLADDLRHRGLRQAVGADGLVVATWVPTERWMQEHVATRPTSPLAAVRAGAVHVGVGDDVAVRVAIVCVDVARCDALVESLKAARERLRTALAGVGAEVERRKKTELAVVLRVPHADAEALLREVAGSVSDVTAPAATR